MTNETSRRCLLGMLAVAPAMALAAPAAAEATETATYAQGQKVGAEITLCHMARAWIDRWQACGGDFALIWNSDGSLRGVTIGITEAALWTPTDEGNEKLRPHMWLVQKEQQAGAKRVLEAMLDMVPGLQETVLEIGGCQMMLGRAA